MKLKKPYIILLLLLSQIAFSQDGIPIYSDYFSDNLYLLHPSMAGAASHNQGRFTARNQWFDQEDAPNLQTLNVNARVSDRSALGAIFFNDKNGYHSQTGGYITYAHHLRFSRSDADLNQLSFGLSLGLMQSRFDESQFDPEDFDPIIAGIIQNSSYFNIDAGVSYNYLDFSGHFTVKNLLFQDRSIYSQDYENNNQRKFLISAAYAIGGIGALWTYEPSFLLQLSESTGEQAIDINFKAYRRMDFGRLWGGLSIRRGLDSSEVNGQNLQYFTPVVGVNLNKLMFAYTYSAQSGDIQFQSGGFHQITIGYDFLAGRDEPYQCNCPAINK
jgi:type IX secretion system PorP/SprF family membrane protein